MNGFRGVVQEFKSIIDINTCELSEGRLPSKQIKLALAWAEIHKEELLADWELASNGRSSKICTYLSMSVRISQDLDERYYILERLNMEVEE